MKRAVVVIFTFLLFPFSFDKTRAYNFVLDSNSYFVPYNGYVNVDFNYELVGYEEDEFKIMPFFDGGEVRVYDPKSNQWVSGSDLWENMPFLSKDVKLKINTQKDTGNIGFYVLNLTSGEVYETNTVSIWTSYVLRGYLEKLNEHLKMLEYHDESP